VTIKRFTEIKAWQAARLLVADVYRTTSTGSFKSDYALRDQLRRAAVSAMSNIAEGFGRGSDREFARYLDIAQGSLVEVQSLLHVALDVGYCDSASFSQLMEATARAIALVSALRTYLSPRATESAVAYDAVDDGRRTTDDGRSA
jgi:four helix bundle protein